MNKSCNILFIFFVFFFANAQQNTINIKASLLPEKDLLQIQQEIIFQNKTNTTFTSIYLHNWANSYSDRKTALSRRMIEDFNKDLYFTKTKNKGFSDIKTLTINFENVAFDEWEKNADIVKVKLPKSLPPNEKVTIKITYIVKVPNAKFTGYGKTKTGYHLRYWYISPAVFNESWQLMSNLNIDDLYEYGTDFKIELTVPKPYVVESNLYTYETKKATTNEYYLVGKNKTDIILSINETPQLKKFKTKKVVIVTDVVHKNLNKKRTTQVLNRALYFLEKHLGEYPHKEIYIDKTTQQKNPIYGLNQLPNFLKPFSDVFKYDVTMFKALARRYLENTILINLRKEHWLIDGIQNYLMIEYVEKFYPEVKLLGAISDYPFIKTFNAAKLKFNDKYPLLYQASARNFLDQPLRTPSDSLSNFNRKIISKYKAGLAFRYLKGYVGQKTLNTSLKELYKTNKLTPITTNKFREILSGKTSKNLDWFFGDFISTNKKIDHKIKKIEQKDDSLKITIKNKRNITAPIALYGLKNNAIVSKKWFTNIDSLATFTIKNDSLEKLVLNYENLYPEYNTYDNWFKINRKFFHKPLKFSFYQDVSDPNYNQFFYQPNISYNFYNGLILGSTIHNKSFIPRNFEFLVFPSYATKSNSIIGSANFLYNQYFEDTNIYKITYGLAGRTSDFASDLSFRTVVPFVNILFKRKSLRDAGRTSLQAKLIHIDKDVAKGNLKQADDNYSILSLLYQNNKINIIKELRYSFRTELAQNFSKAALDIRYRSLTSSNTQLDFRLYAGTFFANHTTGNTFSFGLDRANDYLFELDYLGRSEKSGIFSQQLIIAEGGFKSILPTRFANQYMITFNSSFGLWRWIEFYNDIGFLKNKGNGVFFAYENGIRFNFIHQILELYLPLYSNNGWETSQPNYSQKLRFTLSANFNAIYNFFRRGFM